VKLSVVELYWGVTPCHLAELTNISKKKPTTYILMIKIEKRNSTGLRGVASRKTVLYSHHQRHLHIQYMCSSSNAYADRILLDKPPIALLQHAMQLLINVHLKRI
jgi:hypothetical protein